MMDRYARCGGEGESWFSLAWRSWSSMKGRRDRRPAPNRIRERSHNQVMDAELNTVIVDFVEKVGLLKRDMKQKPEFERYEARFLRIEQKFSALAESIATTDPDFAKTLRRAWQMPATSLAFRNAEHQKELKVRQISTS